MNIQVVKIKDIKSNPNNPRVIKDDKFHKLCESIKAFPKMLELRPIIVNDDMIVLGGNMRLKALKHLGLTEAPVIKASDLTEDQQRQFIIKDNAGFGEWDWDMLANEWDTTELEDWGVDVPVFKMSKVQQGTDTSEYDFENFDQTGFTTIRVVLPDDQAQELIERIDMMKGPKNTSEYIYEHFCN